MISFGRPVISPASGPFPTDSPDIFWSYIAAPFWSDVNTTVNGTISWEIHRTIESPVILSDVSNLIRSKFIQTPFSGTWMLVATWRNVESPSMTIVSS